jgi:hypothetical protein
MFRLRNEGELRPAPALVGPAQVVSTEVQSWAEVKSFTHWQLGNPTAVDGAEFHVPEGELGHIHLGGEIHLALTAELRALLVKRRLAEPFRFDQAWVQAPIRSHAEADRAIWLFRLAYDRLRGADEHDIVGRIQNAHAGLEKGVQGSRASQ